MAERQTEEALPRDSQDFAALRAEMMRASTAYLRLALPAAGLLLGAGVFAPPAFVQGALLVYALGMLLLAHPALGALYRYAHAVGGAGYAWSQVAIAVALSPLLGPLLVPWLVASDHDKEFGAWRQRTAPPRWLVGAETLVVAALFGIGFALVEALGLAGLLVAAIAIPVLYAAFAWTVRRALSG
jgi:hypothetical protein